MKLVARWRKFAPLAVLLVSQSALAGTVVLGSDYLTTPVGFSFFDFGPGIGVVSLQGRPIDLVTLSNTDTIVQRLEDAVLPKVGDSDTIDIMMVALSLESVAPVNIGGSFFDVFVHLDPTTATKGQMTIRHEFPDNLTPQAEGTFSSFFDVFFTADFTKVGDPLTKFSVSDGLKLSGIGMWSHEPPPGAFLLPSPPASAQDGNVHICVLPCDFFPGAGPNFPDRWHRLDEREKAAKGNPGKHNPQLAGNVNAGLHLPEPGSVVLVLSGLAMTLAMKRRIRRS